MACVVWLSMPGVAHAQEDADAQKIRVAQGLYSDAMRAYEAGDYQKAIEGFQAANALYPNAIFEYNIAVCWSALGEPEKALEIAESLSADQLPPENAVKNQARVLAFRRAAKASQVGRDVRFDASRERPASASTWAWPDTLSLGMAAVGAVGLGLTLWLNFEVASLSDEVEEANRAGDFERARAAQDDGESLQLAGRVLGITSGVLLVGGMTWFLVRQLGAPEGDQVGLWLAPAQDGASAGMRFQF